MDDREVVRRMLELFVAQDEAAWELWAEDATSTIDQGWVEPGPFENREQIRAFWSSIGDAFGPDWTKDMTVHEVTEQADGRVLAKISLAPTGASSGVPLEAQMVDSLFTVVDGRIVRAEYSWPREGGRRRERP